MLSLGLVAQAGYVAFCLSLRFLQVIGACEESSAENCGVEMPLSGTRLFVCWCRDLRTSRGFATTHEERTL